MDSFSIIETNLHNVKTVRNFMRHAQELAFTYHTRVLREESLITRALYKRDYKIIARNPLFRVRNINWYTLHDALPLRENFSIVLKIREQGIRFPLDIFSLTLFCFLA